MRVLGVGNCTLEFIGVVDRLLEPDTTKEVLQFSQQGGGAVANAMVALSRWGVRTAFLGKVGDDERGRQIVRSLAEEGVDVQALVLQPKAVSQLSMITIEQGTSRKTTMFTRGNVEALRTDEYHPSILDGVDFLLVDGTHADAEIDLMKAARERGIRVMVDAQTNSPSTRDAVANCDVLVASERFASQFAGVGELKSLCAALLERGPATVVVTLGDEGCVYMDRHSGHLGRHEAFPVEVHDTAGAGDVFHASVIYGLGQGWDLQRCVTFANVAAGLTCTDYGCRGPIPSLNRILEHV